MDRWQLGRVLRGGYGGRRLALWSGGAALLAGWGLLLARYWAAPGRPLTVAFFGLYVLGTVLGWLNCGLWREGPTYYPAGRLLALANGLPGAFYSALFVAYGFDRERLFADVLHGNWNVVLYALIVACQAWSFYLIVRQNFFARPGSAIDPAGGAHPPSPPMVEEALVVLDRAERHGIANILAHPVFSRLVLLLREADDATWFRDPRAQLRHERARALARITAAERRIAEELGEEEYARVVRARRQP